MKHLFSPWRSKYIASFGENKKKECLFCRISKETNNDKQNLIVWRGKYCFVVLNRFPYNAGHLMVVPYKHTSSFCMLTDSESSEVMRVVGGCIKALDKISKPHGYNFGANIGKVAGAGIDKHIHFHLVPRWNGDTNFMPTIGDVKMVSEDIKKLHKQFKKIFNQIKKIDYFN